MTGTPQRILGWLLRAVAGLLILLALVIGALRLLLPMVPQYQEEIRRLAAEATGLAVDFAGISASWPLSGPELSLLDASIGIVDGAPVLLTARELRLGFGLRELLLQRRLVPVRVQVTGSALAVERLAERSQLMVNGVILDWPLQWPEDGRQRIERLDLRLRDIAVTLRDARRLVPQVGFVIGQLGARLAGDTLALDGAFALQEDLGQQLMLVADLPTNLLFAEAGSRPQEWRLELRAARLDLAQSLRLALDRETPVRRGRISLSLDAQFTGWRPERVDAVPEVRNLELALPEGLLPVWNEVGATLRWSARADGWEFAASKLRVVREGRSWPEASLAAQSLPGPQVGQRRLSVRGDFLRIDDVYPLVPGFVLDRLRGTRPVPVRAAGELREVSLELVSGAGAATTFALEGVFDRVGLGMPDDGPAVAGLSGSVRADHRGGRLQIDSREVSVYLPALFRAPLAGQVGGELRWQEGDQGIELRGEDIALRTDHLAGSATLVLQLPPGGSPIVELVAEAQAPEARNVLRYLPYAKLPEGTLRWLDQAIGPGRLHRAGILWEGAVGGFPYRSAPGRFVVELEVADAELDYAPGWPRIDDLQATVVIDGVSLRTGPNRGRIGGIDFADAEVRIADFRAAQLEVVAAGALEAGQLVDFLRASPLRKTLDPTLSDVEARGALRAALELHLPLKDPADFRLSSRIEASGATLGLRPLDHGLTAMRGTVRLDNTRVSAQNFAARFLGEPVRIDLRAAADGEPGYAQVAEVSGSTPAGKLTEAFRLPWPEHLAGSMEWRATVSIPERSAAPDAPALTVRVRSALQGLASTLPPPLDKQADSQESLDLLVTLPPGQPAVELRASLARDIHAAFRLEQHDSRWRLARGAVRSTGSPPELPVEPGLVIAGRLPALRFEDWFPGPGDDAAPETEPFPLREVALGVDRLAVAGWIFADADVVARQRAGAWQIDVAGPAAQGTLRVPAQPDNETPATVELERLWLTEPAEARPGDGPGDPRRIPPAEIRVDDFVLRDMRLGRLETVVRRRPDGLQLEPLAAAGAGFSLEGGASWRIENQDLQRARTELRLTLDSTSTATTLEALGYDPVIQGGRARLTMDLRWEGGPDRNPAEVASGEVSIRAQRGQLLQVEPGGGRVLGLLSVAALPKRLALDFRDVLDKGLTFDDLKGDFRLEGGNAYTCNLGLEGSVTDLAVVGRVGLRDRDYDQLAIVRPHVSDVLALGTAVVGGPAVGATVLLLAQIFRKPLSALGETYYRVGGSWDAPAVTRLQRAEVNAERFRDCERYLAELLPESLVPLLLPEVDDEQPEREAP